MILYKYRDDSNFTEKIFLDQKVWLSNAKGLNDPFECTIGVIAADWIADKVQEAKEAHLAGFVYSAIKCMSGGGLFYGLNSKQTKEYLGKLNKRDFETQYKSMREFINRKTGTELSNPEDTFKNFDEQLNNVGIFSLSETDDNELLWAHYANSSKGIAIGFEVIEGSKLSDSNHCLKVNYSNERPKFNGEGFKNHTSIYANGKNIQKISFEDDTFRKAITTKNVSWSYEREWRYIEEFSGSYDYPGKIVEIVFGLRCPEDIIEKYISLANKHIHNNVDFYKINMSGTKLGKSKVL